MAVFSSKECPWTITGESTCEEKYENAPATAKLGEYCDYKSCKEGSCIRLNAQSPSVCTMVLDKGDKGCSKDDYVCGKDLKCNNDVCESIPKKQEDTTTVTTTENKSSSTKPATTTTTTTTEVDYEKLALYYFMGLIGVLLLIMIILLIVRRQA